MKRWSYSIQLADEALVAKAVARDLPLSVKRLVNLARAIKGMRLEEARSFLELVAAGKQPVPHWRYKGKTAHHRGVSERWGVPQAKYPVKAARLLLKLLRNLEANAENKDLDLSRLRIIHVGVHKSYTLKRYMPRAFGRSTPKYKRHSHVEIVAVEA
ncbi:MAG: 50S ribosomal protein L22 [Fervidicoccaceae archaeon]